MKFLPDRNVLRAMFLAYAVAIAWPGPARAEVTDLSDVPLASSPSDAVLPNLMFVLDDSGSMMWDYMPDNVHYTTAGVSENNCKTASGGSASIANVQCAQGTRNGSADNNTSDWGEPPYYATQFNQIYYNPDITYAPAVNSLGVSYPNSTPTAAARDQFLCASGATVIGSVSNPASGSMNGLSILTVTSVTSGYICVGQPISGAGIGAAFTASISGTVMTVTSVSAGTVVPGLAIFGTGVANGTSIVSNGSGSGGTGTYNINISQTVASGALSGNPTIAAWGKTGNGSNPPNASAGAGGNGNYTLSAPVATLTSRMVTAIAVGRNLVSTYPEIYYCANEAFTASIGTASFTATLSNSAGTGSGNVLNVTAVSAGTLAAGQTITGSGVPGGTTISSQTSGTAGGVGKYTVSTSANLNSRTMTVPSTTLTVTSILNGSLAVGQVITGTGVASNTTITALGTGTGGAGTYTVSISQYVASESMTANVSSPTAAQLADASVCRRNGINNTTQAAPLNYFLYWSNNTTNGTALGAYPVSDNTVAGSFNQQFVFNTGHPYYFTIKPHEYCSDANLINCQLANSDGSAPSGFTIPAPVRYCGTTGNASSTSAVSDAATSTSPKCRQKFDQSNFPYPRYGRFTRVDIVPATTQYTKSATSVRVDCAAATFCTYAEELQNFANWYSYYSIRLPMMKTATGRAFLAIDDRYNVGFITINPGSPVQGAANSPTDVRYVPISTFNAAQKSTWYSTLYAQTNHGSTPLRQALSRIGRHYAGVNCASSGSCGINTGMPEDPIAFSCQQNFTLLTTDGYWNDSDSDAQDITQPTGASVGNQDNTPDTHNPPFVSRPSGTLDALGAQTSTVTPTTFTEQAICNANNRPTFTTNSCSGTTPSRCQCGSGNTQQLQLWQAVTVQSASTNVQTEGVSGSNSTSCTTNYTPQSSCATQPITKVTTPWQVVETQTVAGTQGTSFAARADGSTNSTQWSGATCPANQAQTITRTTNSTQTVNTTNGVPGTPSYSGLSVLPMTSTGCSTTPATGIITKTVNGIVETEKVVCVHNGSAGFSTGFIPNSLSATSRTCSCGTSPNKSVLVTRTVTYNESQNTTSGGPQPPTLSGSTGTFSYNPSNGPPIPSTSCSADPVTGAATAAQTTNPFASTAGTISYSGLPSAVTLISSGATGAPTGPTTVQAGTLTAVTLNPNPTTVVGTGSTVFTPGGTANTLADVAMYYYKNDLRTGTDSKSTPNNVPTTAQDFQNAQHMTTFTLGLGLQGTMTYTPDYQTNPTSDLGKIESGSSGCSFAPANSICDWPAPVSGTPTTLDDLWHAAVNGRGVYFSASDPNSLANGLSGALAALKTELGAASASAVSNPNVSPDNSTLIYSPTFRTVKWDGDITAHNINAANGQLIVSGNASFTGSITGTVLTVSALSSGSLGAGQTVSGAGILPNTTIVSGGTGTGGTGTYNLSLSQTIASEAMSSTATNTQFVWSAQTLLDGKVQSASDSRTIWTFSSAGGTKLKSFLFGSLTTAEGNYFANQCTALSQCPLLNSTQQGQANDGNNMVNFLRGQKGNETTLFRQRDHALGDPVNGQPVFVKNPIENFTDAVTPSYASFKTANASRQSALYVPANDGMLHAFNGDTGNEMWAYVPHIVFPRLSGLASDNWDVRHVYSVDGSPQVGDVFDTTNLAWKTILVAGLNKGGQGYYALDVTDPANPKGLWEACADSTLCAISDPDFGYSYGNPIITKRASDGRWVALVTSGYDNVSGAATGQGYLFVLDALTGAILQKVNAVDGTTHWGSTTTPSGLAKINAFANSFSTNNTAIYVYGGDLYGNIWRFDMSVDPPAAFKVAQLTDSSTSSGNPQSVTTRIELGVINNSRVLFVGTGRYLGVSDLQAPSTVSPPQGPEIWAYQQSLYALKDNNLTTTYANLRLSTTGLVQQTLSDTAGLRSVSGNTVDWNTKNGWYIDFNPGASPGTSPGERVNLDPQLVQGTLVVTTNIPGSSACSVGGDSIPYNFDFMTGSAVGSTTGGVVGQRIYGEITVGIVLVRLPTGGILGERTGAGGSVTPIGINIGSGGIVGRRASWRELIR